MTRQVAVVGAGLMGAGIAQLLLARDYTVSVFEVAASARQVARKRITEICEAIGDSPDCSANLTITDDLQKAVQAAEIVIEAIPEKPALKQQIFADLVRYSATDAVLATNSSVIPVTTVSQHLTDADAARVVGMHFWNPPYLIPLVEVIQGERTAAQTVHRAMEFLDAAGKRPVHVRKDVVVGNRVQHALWREAISLVASGVIDAAGVDNIIKNSFGLRLPVLGPLENADLVGIQLTQDVHSVVFPHLSTETHPNRLLQRMLDAGETGMASGKGFYDWTPESADAKREQLSNHLLEIARRGR